MLSLLSLVATWFAFHPSIATGTTIVQRPVFIVPGATESRLYARVDHNVFDMKNCLNDSIPHNEWFMAYLEKRISFNCTYDILTVNYDEENDRHFNAPGVEIKVEGSGGLKSIVSPTNDVEEMEYMADCLTMLERNGYIGCRNVYGLNYDWRLAINELNETYEEWKRLIEHSYLLNNRTRVVILAHSMGGLIGTYFLRIMEPEWKETYIHKYIPISADFLGSILGITVFPGFPFPYRAGQYGHSIGMSLYMNLITQQIVSLTPGFVNNLPNPIARRDKHEVMVQLPDRNLTIGDYDYLFELLGLPSRLALYHKRHPDLTNGNEHPGVNVSCLYSLGMPTAKKFIYQNWEDFPTMPETVYGEGDLMVEEESLAACTHWASDPRFGVAIHILDANDADHVKTIKESSSLDAIYDLILAD